MYNYMNCFLLTLVSGILHPQLIVFSAKKRLRSYVPNVLSNHLLCEKLSETYKLERPS